MAVYKRNQGFELRTTTWGLSIRVCTFFKKKNFKAGLLIFRAKKSKILRDFQGQIHGKIGLFHRIFVEKKSKFAEKSTDFVGFLREKSQNSQKNRPILRDFSGKKSNFEGFSGANS